MGVRAPESHQTELSNISGHGRLGGLDADPDEPLDEVLLGGDLVS